MSTDRRDAVSRLFEWVDAVLNGVMSMGGSVEVGARQYLPYVNRNINFEEDTHRERER